jgi:hypothetical protein
VVENLYVGSAAVLPDISEANPHLTTTAMAVALARILFEAEATRLNIPITGHTAELLQAFEDLASSNGNPAIRRPGSEFPRTAAVAARKLQTAIVFKTKMHCLSRLEKDTLRLCVQAVWQICWASD